MEGFLVSVVIPTYNRSDKVVRAIESVQKQTYENLEIIVVDDASEDDTKDVVTSIADSRITYIQHETNRNGSAARNTGIEQSKGKYVAFLDDDDEWYSEKVEKQLEVFKRAPEQVALVYCWADVYDEQGKVLTRKPSLNGDIFEDSITSNPIEATSTFMIRREVLEEIRGFDESLKRGQDSDLVRRISKEYHVDYVADSLVRRWFHGDEQIQDESTQNLYYSIDSRKATMEKFADYLSQNPEKEAGICVEIARTYAKIRDWRNCSSWCVRAVRTAPVSLKMYRGLASVGGQVARSVLDELR